MNASDFDRHYVRVLNDLYPNRDAGFAIIMISMPLLERYIRQKAGIGTSSLNENFYKDFVRVFPEARDVSTAKQLWAAFRHGFLHQGTMSVEASGTILPAAYLTHDMDAAFRIRHDGSLVLHPVLFSQKTVTEIQNNFSVFSGTAAGAPPLPEVVRLDPITIPTAYSGNRQP